MLKNKIFVPKTKEEIQKIRSNYFRTCKAANCVPLYIIRYLFNNNYFYFDSICSSDGSHFKHIFSKNDKDIYIYPEDITNKKDTLKYLKILIV